MLESNVSGNQRDGSELILGRGDFMEWVPVAFHKHGVFIVNLTIFRLMTQCHAYIVEGRRYDDECL